MRTLTVHGAARRVDIFGHETASGWLRALLDALKSSRRKYDHLAFSEELGFGPNVTALLYATGKRKITEAAAMRIADATRLRGAAREYFLALVRRASPESPAELERTEALLVELRSRHAAATNSGSELRFFSKWLNTAVFEVLGLAPREGFDAAAIASSIEPRPEIEDVEEALTLLLGLGSVTRDEGNGRYRRTTDTLDLGDEVPGLAIVGYHRQMMDLAKLALDRFAPHERDVSGLSLAVNEADLELLKREIARFRDYLLTFASHTAAPDRVVQVNIQLFPLSQKVTKTS